MCAYSAYCANSNSISTALDDANRSLLFVFSLYIYIYVWSGPGRFERPLLFARSLVKIKPNNSRRHTGNAAANLQHKKHTHTQFNFCQGVVVEYSVVVLPTCVVWPTNKSSHVSVYGVEVCEHVYIYICTCVGGSRLAAIYAWLVGIAYIYTLDTQRLKVWFMISNEIIFGKVVYMDARRAREDEWVTTNEIDCSITRERERDLWFFIYITYTLFKL